LLKRSSDLILCMGDIFMNDELKPSVFGLVIVESPSQLAGQGTHALGSGRVDNGIVALVVEDAHVVALA
jgi:hypothetical protein